MKDSLRRLLDDCENELKSIEAIVGNDPLAQTTQYLNKYGIIKACGTIENVFKSIIADYFDQSSMTQVHNFINKNVRESSANPRYSKICDMLKLYDEKWSTDFKKKVKNLQDSKKLIDSLDSLVEQRNAFAHGKNTTITIGVVLQYYKNAIKIIEILDNVVV